MSYYNEEEEDVLFGTPFAPLEAEEMVTKKPEIDLTVRDSRGRRRFHGAFTGGFSAGFWNTVGSEEGFTPRQYVSNRNEKWDQTLVQKKPEDFMDCEDLDVFGIAPKRIKTKDKFAEQEFAGLRSSSDSLIDVLKSVIKPTIESIGVKLYKQMKRNTNTKSYIENRLYGCEKASNKTINNEIPFCIYKPKSDFHGIGYKGINNDSNSYESKSSSGVSAVMSSGRKLMISGEAFGYGVLDEDNDEEAVVYQKDDMSQYDFAIDSMRLKVNDSKKDKHKAIEYGKSDTLKGFVKTSTKSNLLEIISKKYPIPVLPRNWRPSSQSEVGKQKKSRWDQTNSHTESLSYDNSIASQKPKPPVLNANIRAVLLGEEVVHRSGVKPVEIESNNKSLDNSSKVLSNEIKERERRIESENISLSKKPLIGFWANKFTRSSVGVEENTLSGGLTDFKSQLSVDSVKGEDQEKDANIVIERTIYEWHPHTLLCKRFNIPNPYPQYPDVIGIVTVGKSDVRNRTSQMTAKKSKPNIFECLFQNESKTVEAVCDTNLNNTTDSNQIKTSMPANDDIGENDEPTRPPMDLFKAIFASDEEESEDENSNNDNNSNKNSEQNVNNGNSDRNSVINENLNQLSGTKASGIFANIDFDQLNRNFTPVLKTNETPNEKCNETEKNDISKPELSDDFYGPALPPTFSVSNDINFNINSNINSNNNSIETKTKSSKRKTKDKKHKKHKKTSASHKKHKRHRKSSSSSSSSEIDVNLKILQYIKTARK